MCVQTQSLYDQSGASWYDGYLPFTCVSVDAEDERHAEKYPWGSYDTLMGDKGHWRNQCYFTCFSRLYPMILLLKLIFFSLCSLHRAFFHGIQGTWCISLNRGHTQLNMTRHGPRLHAGRLLRFKNKKQAQHLEHRKPKPNICVNNFNRPAFTESASSCMCKPIVHGFFLWYSILFFFAYHYSYSAPEAMTSSSQAIVFPGLCTWHAAQ